MDSLEDELNDEMRLDVAPILDEIKAKGGGLEGLSMIIEQVVMPLLSGQKAAILRLARELDELRLEIVEQRAE
jgi:hypothetical protein